MNDEMLYTCKVLIIVLAAKSPSLLIIIANTYYTCVPGTRLELHTTSVYI